MVMLGIDPATLLIVWDADFLYGPSNAAGADIWRAVENQCQFGLRYPGRGTGHDCASGRAAETQRPGISWAGDAGVDRGDALGWPGVPDSGL